MFNQYTIIRPRFSAAVDFAAVNVLQGRCIIRFKESGAEYIYKNVSRRRLLSLTLDNNKSLGFWIQFLAKNAVIENALRPMKAMTYKRIGTAYHRETLPSYLATQVVA